MTSFMKYQILNNYMNNNIYQNYILQHNNSIYHKTSKTNNQPSSYKRNIININKNTIVNKTNEEYIIDSIKILELQTKYFTMIQSYNNYQRLVLLQKLKHIKYFNNEHNYSKSVELLDNYVVKKTLKYNTLGFHLFKNELMALTKLSHYKHFPKLIAYDIKQLTIYMSYCGETINSNNLPKDWIEQLKTIRNILEITNVNSNDMLLRNTCVLNNTIYIIDFGLDNIFKENINTVINKFYQNLKRLQISHH